MIENKGTWRVVKSTKYRGGRQKRMRRRYLLALDDRWGWRLIAITLSRKQLREFCDAATDALDGTFGTVHDWTTKPRNGNRIELVREVRGGFLHVHRDVLTDLVAQIDQLLED